MKAYDITITKLTAEMKSDSSEIKCITLPCCLFWSAVFYLGLWHHYNNAVLDLLGVHGQAPLATIVCLMQLLYIIYKYLHAFAYELNFLQVAQSRIRSFESCAQVW